MTNDKFISFTMDKTKHIALVAHDGKKKELVKWCEKNKDILKNHFLCGTGTTAKLIAEKNRTSGERILQRTAGRRSADRFPYCGRRN